SLSDGFPRQLRAADGAGVRSTRSFPFYSSLLLISLISTSRTCFVSTRISANITVLLFSPLHLLPFKHPQWKITSRSRVLRVGFRWRSRGLARALRGDLGGGEVEHVVHYLGWGLRGISVRNGVSLSRTRWFPKNGCHGLKGVHVSPSSFSPPHLLPFFIARTSVASTRIPFCQVGLVARGRGTACRDD
ncbi:hypothetical protein PFISCL1PPCAC_21906, partial [Pristionchus fissidentatus]